MKCNFSSEVGKPFIASYKVLPSSITYVFAHLIAAEKPAELYSNLLIPINISNYRGMSLIYGTFSLSAKINLSLREITHSE